MENEKGEIVDLWVSFVILRYTHVMRRRIGQGEGERKWKLTLYSYVPRKCSATGRIIQVWIDPLSSPPHESRNSTTDLKNYIPLTRLPITLPFKFLSAKLTKKADASQARISPLLFRDLSEHKVRVMTPSIGSPRIMGCWRMSGLPQDNTREGVKSYLLFLGKAGLRFGWNQIQKTSY